MGVALSVEVTGSRNAARLRAACLALASSGLGLSAFQVGAGPTRLIDGAPALHLALAIGLAVAALALAWRGLAEWRGGVPDGSLPTLAIDEAGAVAVSAGPGRPARPLALRASCQLPGLIVLVLAPSPGDARAAGPGRLVTLLLGRDQLPDDAWRKLLVWLRWMERGRHSAT